MKKLLITTTLLFSIISLQSQSIRKIVHNERTKLVLPKDEPKTGNSENKEKTKSIDYILYRDVVKRYSWMEGLGEPITQEVANHLPYYYRLSYRNNAGHWQHVEALHGMTLTSNHNQSIYRLGDGKAENEWTGKLQTVSQWFLTASLDGKEMVEERAYDNEGNMIYSFSPVKSNKNEVTGSYYDEWGYPVDFREDPENTYGSIVCISYDRNGCDSIINYLDGKGYRKKNSDGVDQTQYIRDDMGRIMRESSHNLVGDPILDKDGNCGNIYAYGDGFRIETHVDANFNPMRLPQLRQDASHTYVRKKIELDEWGRDSIITYLDAEGKADTTNEGIHKIVLHYSNDGSILPKEYYDIFGGKIDINSK